MIVFFLLIVVFVDVFLASDANQPTGPFLHLEQFVTLAARCRVLVSRMLLPFFEKGLLIDPQGPFGLKRKTTAIEPSMTINPALGAHDVIQRGKAVLS